MKKSSNVSCLRKFKTLIFKVTKGYLKAVKKEQVIEWMSVQSYLRLSNLQKYLNKQYIETSNLLVKIVKESEKSKKKMKKLRLGVGLLN